MCKWGESIFSNSVISFTSASKVLCYLILGWLWWQAITAHYYLVQHFFFDFSLRGSLFLLDVSTASSQIEIVIGSAGLLALLVVAEYCWKLLLFYFWLIKCHHNSFANDTWVQLYQPVYQVHPLSLVVLSGLIDGLGPWLLPICQLLYPELMVYFLLESKFKKIDLHSSTSVFHPKYIWRLIVCILTSVPACGRS